MTVAGPVRAGYPAVEGYVWLLGTLTVVSFIGLLVSVILGGPPLTWVAVGVYVLCAGAFALATARRRPYVAFILPGLSFYMLFVVFPTIEAFRVSLYQWSGIGEPKNFIGLQNFADALTSQIFYNAFWHNIVLFVSIFILQNTIGLFLAVLLHGRPRFHEIYRAAIV